MVDILFPKPLPTLNTLTIQNELGFVSSEIVALVNVWRLIKCRLKYHATQIFLGFFTDNESLIERFRGPQSKFNLSSLHQHPHQLLQLFGNIIENGLDDLGYVNSLMTEVSQRHKQHGISYDDIKRHTSYIKEYIMIFFINIKSRTLASGLEKLCELIDYYHVEK